MRRLAVLVIDGAALHLHPDDASVRLDEAVLDVEMRLRLDTERDGLPDPFEIGGVEHLLELLVSQDGVGLKAEAGLEGGGAGHLLGLEVAVPGAELGDLERHRQLAVGNAKRGLLVAQTPLEVRDAPGGVAFGSCAFVCRRWGERAAGPIPILIAHDLGRLGCGPFAFRRRPLQRYRVSAQLWNPPMHLRAKV